jgi:uncharacterized membrane protein YccF (DUF307 family)
MIVFSKAIIFVLCLNLACWMVAQSGVMPAVGLTPFGNSTNKVEEIEKTVSEVPLKNPENLVTLVTGYVWFALQFLWQLASWIVFGFPLFLSSLGLPSLVTVPLGALWFTLFGLFLVEFLGGRGT